MKQQTLSDMEYGYRKKKTKREEFLDIMDEIIPWDEWISVIRPYYPTGERGRPPVRPAFGRRKASETDAKI